VRSYLGLPSSTFSIGPVAELDSVDIDVADDDVLFSLVMKGTQLMRGSTPWNDSFAYTFFDFMKEHLSTLVARLVAISWP
jgi:hypothetical protein